IHIHSPPMVINHENVQGLILRGYNYPYSRHLLFHFPGGEAGQTFLAWARPLIPHGGAWPSGVKPQPLLNVGLTFEGLKALGLASIVASINPNLVTGPAPS